MFDKIPFHRILALFTLFCVMLTACTTAPALTPTATMPVETPTPSATATASATPTETPDPNAPEGWTGKDKDGNYIMEKDGMTFTWTKAQYGNNPESYVDEWTYSAIVDPKGIWIYDTRAFVNMYSSATRMIVNLLPSDQPGNNLWIDHPDPSAAYPTWQSGMRSFSVRFFDDLSDKMRPISKETIPQFTDRFFAGNVTVNFTTPDGATYHWNPAHDYIVTQVSFDEATGPEFFERTCDFDTSIIFRIAIRTDKDGNLYYYGAVSDFSKLNDDNERALFVTAGLSTAIRYANDTIDSGKNAPTFEPSFLNRANLAVSESGYSHLVFITK